MLSIQFSNRFEVLRDAVIAQLGGVTASPFVAHQVVVPSTAMRRALTLAVADDQGVCANVDFMYLAQWLWRQIGRVVESVEAQSPFAAPVLAWRIYALLEDPAWYASFPRLANYLDGADPVRRLDLAVEIAAVLEQYITYRQEWLNAWATGGRVDLGQESTAHPDDQDWQAELWRRLVPQMGSRREHPANQFFRSLEAKGAAGGQPSDLPQAVHVFCLPDIPPLYLKVLIGLGRWIDVRLYVLNPCREFWFEIVDPKRLSQLVVRGAAQHQETGNRLLASWGKQTKAQIELLLDRAADAPIDDEGYCEEFPDTRLGHVQRSIFNLVEIEPGSIAMDPADRSIEVHVCHSLTRELEVLQDQLLNMFASPARLALTDVLVVTPDLEAAAPLIDAVFGNAPPDRLLPYAVSGRGRSSVNAPARALLDLLAILPSRFPGSALLELLQQPIIGRRFHIGSDERVNVERWMRLSGMRWGIDGDHRRELGLPGLERFTVEDGLHRLFLGYALPEQVSVPVFDRVPAGNPEGSSALDLGLFAHFFHRLTALRTEFLRPRSPDAWAASLLGVLEEFLLPIEDEFDDLGEVREAIGELRSNMARGAITTPIPLPVIRSALHSLLDDSARGAVPTGSITFSSMSSLRNLPFRVICVIGLNDGAFPQISRPTEFDLMAAKPLPGDRQRRLDDRNLFLDLLLAARERFYLSYTGRSVLDNSIRPASVVVSELIETLLPAMAETPADPDSLEQARRRLVVEHPLQAFSPAYFVAGGDPRLRSFNRELCDALRGSGVRATEPPPGWDAAAGAEEGEEEDEEREAAGVEPFFAAPLAVPGEEWRTVSLDQLVRFFRNPCRYLLRERLGIALFREESFQSDDEPFVPDFPERQALAERLLPQAMQGLGDQELERLAMAGIEYPGGALGTALLQEELATLRHFAATVRDATQPPAGPPITLERDFQVDGETWRLATVLTGVRRTGLALHRYDDTRPTDYLTGWLTHLVLCAAAPAGTELRTRWISRDGEYRLNHCQEAAAILESLLGLYRRGLREPLHFFPKSAWVYQLTDSLANARDKWRPAYGEARGESEDAAYRLAFRGQDNPIDSNFEESTRIVFGGIRACLEDPRIDAVPAGTPSTP